MFRTFLPMIAALSLAVAAAGETPAVTPPAVASAQAAAPDAMLKRVVAALRANDLLGLYKAMPTSQRAELEQAWTAQASTPDPQGDAQLNLSLAMVNAPNAVDLLMSQLEPELAALDPKELVAGLQGIGGFLALAGSQPKDPGAGASVDYAALQGFLADLAAWIPGAGLNDKVKARQALEHVIAGAKALGLKNAAELRALKLEELFARLGPAVKELKLALATYALNADALLDSITVAKIEGEGDQRTLSIAFITFGHPHTVPVKMVKKDGAWAVAEGKDSPLAGLSQLMMLGMMMGGPGGDAPRPQPAPVPGGGNGQPPL
jgi:hypothetical protein